MDRRIRFPATIDHLPKAIECVLSCAREAGISVRRMQDIHLAVEEAVVNIINYAYEDSEGDFDITCASHDDGRFTIEISDRGLPFNILSVSPPNMNANITERLIGGLGVHLIKNLMDEVNYRYEGNKNILTLTIWNK
jgi:serine/threonine-protein kinase RsbW